ncbi:hypothetical protein MJO28_002653 [Puccinia striiformis f. sp. tritici]|uniref:Uncharacterized protein n=1 Tax=Puccinia striiformis f. sp. tritici TaxID=168172 RepID=A0ACC0EQY4_9BASI|nr:hypothetical protein MJO28_002653 [Puccinia striiformis f. sp. tritici]KAI7964626.1 hypothetical protein MJO29_002724 [Puccinia striiformis f. sp. tritici]
MEYFKSSRVMQVSSLLMIILTLMAISLDREYGNRLEEVVDGLGKPAGEQASAKSTQMASIKPNRLTWLQLKLHQTTLSQTYSYLFFLNSADESLLQATNQAAEKVKKNDLFDPFLNLINSSIDILLCLFGALVILGLIPDHIKLHLDFNQSPTSLTDLTQILILLSTQANSFAVLIVIIEPLLLNLSPMFTILPLISTVVCMLSVIYLAKLPPKSESFVKHFSR